MPDYFIGIEIEGKTIPVGTLAVFENRGKDFTRFQYDNAWIEHPLGFEIDPMLPLVKGFLSGTLACRGPFRTFPPIVGGVFCRKERSPVTFRTSGP